MKKNMIAACAILLFTTVQSKAQTSKPVVFNLPEHEGLTTFPEYMQPIAWQRTVMPVVKKVTLSTGVTLEYSEQGDPQGIPVLLLHGITDSRHSFDLVLPHLPASFHVYAISQRGHGNSGKPASGYTPVDFAADLDAFIKQQNLPPVIIVGHSMSSTIAQRFALNYPQQVRGIVLACAFATFKNKPDVAAIYEGLFDLKDPLDTAFVLEFQQSTLAQPIPPDYLKKVVNESLKVPISIWRQAFAGLLATDYIKELNKIKKPTLIVWGNQDAFCPRHDQDAIVSAIAGAQLLVYKGTGHAVHWEQPQRFAEDLITFIEKLTSENTGRK